MDEIFVNIKLDTELSARFKKDFISIEELFGEYYEVCSERDQLKEELEELKADKDEY